MKLALTTELGFAPVPTGPGAIVVKVGKIVGLLVWQFANGDGILRHENTTYYIPAGGYTELARVSL